MRSLAFVALDCETTGLNPAQDKIIEFGAVKFTLDTNTAEYSTLIAPGLRLPSIVRKITGISDADLIGAPAFSEQHTAIQDFIGDSLLIGHNLIFDLDFLAAHGLDFRTTHIRLDTFDLAGLVLPRVKSRNLAALSNELGLSLKDAHRALPDARATRELFRALITRAEQFPHARWQQISSLELPPKNWLTKFADILSQATEHTPPQESQQATHETITEKNVQESELSATLQTSFETNVPCLLETDASPNDLAAAILAGDQQTILAVPNPPQADTLARMFGGAFLPAPQFFVHPERLANLCAGPLTISQGQLVAKASRAFLVRPDPWG